MFFLDDAVALAAGHRPCGLCRRDDYLAYRSAVSGKSASDLNRRLAKERLRRGRGIDRAGDRVLWSAPIDDLPDGAVIVDDGGAPRLVLADRLLRFSFDGWTAPAVPSAASRGPRPHPADVGLRPPPRLRPESALLHGGLSGRG